MSLSSLDLNLLVVLDAVLSERSVARAAERLHVTPSAISNSLARLRAVLGDPLIVRSGRGIVPTPRAAELAPAIARALGEIDGALHARAFDPKTTTRELSLAIADAGQVAWLPSLAAAMSIEMPRARLRVVGIDALVARGGLAAGDIDASIGRADRSPGIHATQLCEEPMVLVVRSDHPLGAPRRDLASLRHVDVHVATGRPNADLVKAYARAGLPREVAMVVPTFTAAAAVAATTDLAATIPASLLEALRSGLPIRTVRGAPPLSNTLHLCWHERTHHDPAAKALREIVLRTLARPRKPSRRR